MILEKLKFVLILNCLLIARLVHGFNGNGGWNLPSFLRFQGSIDPPDEKSFSLSIDESDLSENFLKFFEISISNEERMIIERGQALLTQLEKKHDCFKDATMTLKNGCRNVNLSNDDKIQYAVRLTKCEIATANLDVPMECDDFNHDVGRCIESISRIPQFWTSYSGYFREVSQMCFAMRYSLERDALEGFHRNVTLKYYDILKHLQEIMISLRKEEVSQIKQFLKNFAKDIKELEKSTSFVSNDMKSIKGILSDFQLMTQNASSQITHLNEELGNFAPYTRATFDEINNANKQHLSTLKDLTVSSEDIRINFERLGRIYQYLQKIDAVAQDTLSSQEQVYHNVEDVKNQHRELLNQLREAKQNLQNLLDASQNEIQGLTKSLYDAREIQEDFMKILKPLSVLVDLSKWIYGGILFGNNVIYVIPLFSVVFWTLFGKVVAIFVTVRLLYLYANQYETFDERLIQSFLLVVTGGILSRLCFEDKMISKLFNILRRLSSY